MQQPAVGNDTILHLLQELHASGAPAALFVEDQGLGNENGVISLIEAVAGSYRIVLANGSSFTLEQVMAVNGVFRSGFSTC